MYLIKQSYVASDGGWPAASLDHPGVWLDELRSLSKGLGGGANEWKRARHAAHVGLPRA